MRKAMFFINDKLKVRLEYLLGYARYDGLCDKCLDKLVDSIVYALLDHQDAIDDPETDEEEEEA